MATGKRYRGYGVTLKEYCGRIGISASRWYRMARGLYHEISPQMRKQIPGNAYALLEEEEMAIVEYAEDHPRYFHRELTYRMIDEDIVYTSESTVYRILKKHGLIKKNDYKKKYGWVHRYSNEAGSADELWQADITYLQYKGKDVYQLTFIDVYSRFVVFTKTLTSMDSKTVREAFERFISEYGCTLSQKPKLQTDNGSCFVGAEFQGVVKKYIAEHSTIHPSMPMENVIIERWHRTFKELLYEMEEPEDFAALERITREACEYYNYKRYHKSLGYMTPYEWYKGNPIKIAFDRKNKLEDARKKRKEYNCIQGKDSLFLTAENSHFV